MLKLDNFEIEITKGVGRALIFLIAQSNENQVTSHHMKDYKPHQGAWSK